MTYIWEKEVQSIEGTKVTFVDSTEIEFTPKQLEYIVTEEPKDPSAFRNLTSLRIASDVLELFKDHNIKKWELDNILNTIVFNYNSLFYTALGKKFGTYEEGLKFTPQAFEESITMADLLN